MNQEKMYCKHQSWNDIVQYCSLLFPNCKTYVKRTTEDRRDTIRTEKKYRLNNWKVNIQL